jgi:hypothetical protein
MIENMIKSASETSDKKLRERLVTLVLAKSGHPTYYDDVIKNAEELYQYIKNGK